MFGVDGADHTIGTLSQPTSQNVYMCALVGVDWVFECSPDGDRRRVSWWMAPAHGHPYAR